MTDANIPDATFHMSDFEAWKHPFDFELPDGKRDKARHEKLLNALLDAIIVNLDELVGFVAEPETGKPSFKDAYETNIAKAIKEAAISTRQSGAPVTMVFAKHKDFKAARIGEYFDHWDDGDGRLTFGGVGEPSALPQLQAADLIVYEMSRWGRSERPEENRYPMRRLIAAFKEKQKLKSGRFIVTYIP